MPGAQQMTEAARLFARDPFAFAGGRGDAAVEALRDFERDERAIVP